MQRLMISGFNTMFCREWPLVVWGHSTSVPCPVSGLLCSHPSTLAPSHFPSASLHAGFFHTLQLMSLAHPMCSFLFISPHYSGSFSSILTCVLMRWGGGHWEHRRDRLLALSLCACCRSVLCLLGRTLAGKALLGPCSAGWSMFSANSISGEFICQTLTNLFLACANCSFSVI